MQVIEYPIGQIPAWSVSTLQKFLECEYRMYWEKVQRIPTPDSPAAARGTAIHQEAEDFLNGVHAELPESLGLMKDEFSELLEYHHENSGAPEQEWAFTREWERTEWFGPDAWARFKLDYVGEVGDHGRVIDFKTGRRYPTKHAMQMIYYAIAFLIAKPEIQKVDTELWYLDHKPSGALVKKTYSRGQAMQFYPSMQKRAVEMTRERRFKPQPSQSACRFCPFNGNQCKFGV